ncbi:MAG: type II secretion system F family protein [Pseudomonadota bacterium]
MPAVDPTVLAAVLGLLLFATLAIGTVVAVRFGPQARLRKRIATITGAGARGGQSAAGKELAARKTKLISSKAADLTSGGKKAQRRADLRLLIEQAGLTMTRRGFLIFSAICAAAGTAGYLIMGYPLFGAVPTAIVMGLWFPRMMIKRRAKKRQHKFTSLFADAIDVIVRGIRTGLPVAECLNIIARDSPPPVCEEFKLLIEGQRLGMTLKEALEKSTKRMPTADLKFFGIVLILQQQTGGNLAETLSNLSGILRARKKMADKVKAMSSEARMTATIIGSMPFILSLVIYAMNPDYISLLWTDQTGLYILYGGLGWMSVGILWMKMMINFEI